jgi:hypothetical protein
LKALALEISMKRALFALVVLFASLLTYGQTATPNPPTPKPPAVATPVTEPMGVSQAGGLDDRCQAGLLGEYKMDEKGFGNNDAKESETLSNASACIGYITGWSQTIDTAFIAMGNKLWFVEISDTFDTTIEADGLHEYLKTNPDERIVASSLILLNVAIDKKMATISPVEIKDAPGSQPQSDPNSVPPTLKSKI